MAEGCLSVDSVLIKVGAFLISAQDNAPLKCSSLKQIAARSNVIKRELETGQKVDFLLVICIAALQFSFTVVFCRYRLVMILSAAVQPTATARLCLGLSR